MIATLPAVSHLGPIAMICTQAGAGSLAITAALFTGQPAAKGAAHALPAASVSESSSVSASSSAESVSKMARRVWNFGFVQLLGIVGLNAGGLVDRIAGHAF